MAFLNFLYHQLTFCIMAQKVIVSIPKNEDGTPKHDLIKVSEKNAEWGSVNVVTTQISMGSNGILDQRKRSSYFRAKVETLQALGLKEGDDLNAKLADLSAGAVRIKRTETTEPAYEGHQQKLNPTTSELIFTTNGQPIFMQDTVAPAGEEDQLIGSAAPVAVVAGDGMAMS